MDIPLILSLVSSLLFMVGITWYVVDVYKGKVRVAVASVMMLVLINISGLGALVAKELWYVVPFTAVAAFMNCLIIIFGIKNGKFQLTKQDIVIFIGALAGLVAWLATGDAAYNIYILTAVMLISIYPIVSKTFNDPTSETRLPWILTFISSLILLGTITSAEPAGWLVQARQFLFGLLMVIALYLPFGRKPTK